MNDYWELLTEGNPAYGVLYRKYRHEDCYFTISMLDGKIVRARMQVKNRETIYDELVYAIFMDIEGEPTAAIQSNAGAVYERDITGFIELLLKIQEYIEPARSLLLDVRKEFSDYSK